MGCSFAFWGYVVRSHEFLLVLAVALPLLPWQALLRQRATQGAFIILILALFSANFIDKQAYRGAEWQTFNAFNAVRILFTDYGIGKYLQQQTTLLARYDYTPNDIDLISNWFFVDPTIANPKALQAMLAELGPLPIQTHALSNGWLGIKMLWHPNLLPLFLAALLLAILRPHRKIALSWVLCVAAVFMLGLLGRPGILRVYIPLLSLLVIAPNLITSQKTVWHNNISFGLLLVACLFNATKVFHESRTMQKTAQKICKSLSNFPSGPTVVWGGSFPFEAVYPVLAPNVAATNYRLYSLSCFTLAPFSTVFAEKQAGRGMVERLVSRVGVPIVASQPRLNFLKIYCKTHLHGQLQTLSVTNYGLLTVNQQQCEIEQ